MGHRQAQGILPAFRQHILDVVRGVILELVQVQIERFSLRSVGPRESSLLELGDQESRQQPVAFLAHYALGEVDQKDQAVIHHLSEIDGRLPLTEDGLRIRVEH